MSRAAFASTPEPTSLRMSDEIDIAHLRTWIGREPEAERARLGEAGTIGAVHGSVSDSPVSR